MAVTVFRGNSYLRFNQEQLCIPTEGRGNESTMHCDNLNALTVDYLLGAAAAGAGASTVTSTDSNKVLSGQAASFANFLSSAASEAPW